jgi:uncharacterized protein YndB with AHSA1/START domain
MTGPSPEDTAAQLDAVSRAVETEGTRSSVILSQVYATDVDDLWEACTTADRLARWFAPVTGDLRLGGRYQVEGNAGGVVESCDPPKAFTLTWEIEGEVSWVDVRLAAEGPDRTRLTLVHRADVDPERWGHFGPGAVGVGWDLGLLGLALHLATGAGQPAEGSGWETSDDAKAFMRGSSERWGDAAIAGGEPEADARGAQGRTTAAYLGEEPPGAT